MDKLTLSVMLFWLILLSQSDSTAQPGLFTLVNSVTVTPVDSMDSGAFVRIGYVPGRDKMVVTFKARLARAGCIDPTTHLPSIYAYGYREFTTDMTSTGKQGVFSCQTGPDIGGGFVGNDFYAVAMGHDNVNNKDGWFLAKYNAVDWATLVPSFFYPMAPEELGDDPMVAVVNGQIDFSSHYKKPGEIGPGHQTHHQFFSPTLQLIGKRVLEDTSHINLTSLLVVNGVISFITSTDLWGDMIVLQYNSSWTYLGTKTLKRHASAPEGAAFDGSRFYVSYVDNSLNPPGIVGHNDNIRLAAFDLGWNLVDDIAVTSYDSADHKAPARPSMTLHNGRIYVCYDQNENTTSTASLDSLPVQVHVKVYDVAEPAASAPVTAWHEPIAFSLSQNYPNPFNPTTVISYQLPQTSHVILRIYDVLGEEVQILVNERQNAGTHSVTFDANNLPAGAYFYRIQAGTFMETKKLTILK